MDPVRHVAIVGVGLIGGSIALAARRAWPTIHISGVDREGILADALARRVIDESRASVVDLGDADIVILAAPVTEIISQLAVIARANLPGIVTDVGSTKRDVMSAASAASAEGSLRFVGGHPIAGSAHGGVAHARADLFDGRRWALVEPDDGRSPETQSDAFSAVAEFVSSLGAVPVGVDAAQHDRLMAYVSHAPQLVASGLMAAVGEAVGFHGLEWAGAGLKDTTRLAASPSDVWQGIVATNADFIREAVDATQSRLAMPLGSADIERLFAEANEWKKRLEH